MTFMLGLGRARANRQHRYVANNLSAYIDGQLTAAERARVERHLAACADCRRDVETLRQTVALLRRVPLKPVPRSFALPASARAAQARHRRWNAAFGAMRTATVTIATLLVMVFAGDAALTSGLVSLPGARTASDASALLYQERGQTQSEEAAPMMAEAAPKASPEAAPQAESEAAPEPAVEPYGATEATAAPDAPSPGETARALQPPRETWPGPQAQPGAPAGGEGGGPDMGGVGGAGGMGGTVPVMPRTNGVGGAEEGSTTAEAEPPAALAAEATETAEGEAQVESLAQAPDEAETPAEEPQPEAMMAPKTVPTPAPQPTQLPPTEPATASEAEESATPGAMVMRVEPGDGDGKPAPEAERVQVPARPPQPAWWQASRSLRLIGGFLAGMLLIALAGTIWTGYKRGVPK